jgi:two-component SAPR family response regulator
MPEISGLEFARTTADIDRKTKIILMSAFPINKQEFDKVMPSTRVDAFIAKPVKMKKLIDHIEALTKKERIFDYSMSSMAVSATSSLMTLPTELISGLV